MEAGLRLACLPAPDQVRRLLVWHQGALGDLLLAGPALVALSRHYSSAVWVAVGHPERWGLFHGTLPLEAIWDGGESRFTWLYSGQAEIPRNLAAALGTVDLAVVFTPRPQLQLLARFHQAGVSAVVWVPSFDDTVKAPVAHLQAHRLADLGLAYEPQPLKLNLGNPSSWKGIFQSGTRDGGPEKIKLCNESSVFPSRFPTPTDQHRWVAVAPGSGNPRKNWPLSHYYELTRSLVWEHRVRVVWLVGPAEKAWLPYLQGLTQAQDMTLLADASLKQVAQVLAQCHLYIGGDSGLSHLAAAVDTPQVLVLFGPTNPLIWAPFAPQVSVLTSSMECVPCARGREISCSSVQCLQELSPETVLRRAARLLNF